MSVMLTAPAVLLTTMPLVVEPKSSALPIALILTLAPPLTVRPAVIPLRLSPLMVTAVAAPAVTSEAFPVAAAATLMLSAVTPASALVSTEAWSAVALMLTVWTWSSVMPAGSAAVAGDVEHIVCCRAVQRIAGVERAGAGHARYHRVEPRCRHIVDAVSQRHRYDMGHGIGRQLHGLCVIAQGGAAADAVQQRARRSRRAVADIAGDIHWRIQVRREHRGDGGFIVQC